MNKKLECFYRTAEKKFISFKFLGKDLAMRTIKLSGLFLICACCVILMSGCASELRDLKIQNDTQRKRIAELESEVQTTELKLEQLQRKLNTAEGITNAEVDALKQSIVALEEDLNKKKALIATMQQRLLYGGMVLPVELSTMLEDFAKGKEMVAYDSSRGVVKFKSDLLFKRGSDKVAPEAIGAIKSLCEILNSKEGKSFDIVIAGHTDDMRIARPATRAEHPTNWHLSAHRAIAVLNTLTKNGLQAKRMSVRGFGEFRPTVPNKPNQDGNKENRRVEIYIVPAGA